MSKTNETTAAHDHGHMTFPNHPHRGAANEIKLRDGDCAVIFRKDDCPEFITNVPHGEQEEVSSENFLFSPYFMTDLIFAIYHGHPAMLTGMSMLAKIHAKTGANIEVVGPDGAPKATDKETEATPGLDTPVIAVH